jgi:8-oxo-dGTP diphosphatase
MKRYIVVAAIIIDQNKVLCVQRKANKYDYISYKYEFPGGKVEPGETDEEALIREIKEELNLLIEIKRVFITVDHAYPDFKLTMHSFLCTPLSSELVLKEHQQFQWLHVSELDGLDWAAADIPIVNKLKESLEDAYII